MFRKLNLLCFVIVVTSLLFGCGSIKSEARKSYEEALKLYEEGLYEQSVSSFLRAISQGEKSSTVYADLAIAYLKTGNEDKAMDAMNKAFGKGSEDQAVLYRAGLYYREKGDFETARSYLAAAIPVVKNEKDENPDTYPIYAYLADCEMECGLYEEALAHYQKLILSGYHKTAHKILAGECYLRMGQLSAAVTYFNWAEEDGLKPDQYLYIYRILQKNGQYVKAEEFFQRGLSSLSSSDDPSMSIGEYYANAGKYSAAEQYLTDETSFGAMMAKAYFATEKGDYEMAFSYYKELLAEGKNESDVYVQYFVTAAMSGDLVLAEQILNQLRTYHDPAVDEIADWNEIMLLELKFDYKNAYSKLNSYMTRYGVTEEAKREQWFLSRVL